MSMTKGMTKGTLGRDGMVRRRNWKAGVSGILRDLFLITIPQKLLLSSSLLK